MKTFDWNPNPETQAHAIAYLHDPITEMPVHRTKRPCVVVLPGGAYRFCSMREADPVAFEYFTAGFNVILIDSYSVAEMAKNYNPLCDVGHTIMQIREHAEEWGCDPQAIVVLGFSAGGHLAATSGTMWNDPVLQEKLHAKNGENRPNGMILCYPVIRADELTHEESIRNVSGCEPGTDGYRFWAAQDHVDEKTCPAFIWHTVTDAAVPVENSIAMISALQAHKISFECHLFPAGQHGMSVCTQESSPDWDEAAYNARWVDMSIQWLYRLFNYQK